MQDDAARDALIAFAAGARADRRANPGVGADGTALELLLAPRFHALVEALVGPLGPRVLAEYTKHGIGRPDLAFARAAQPARAFIELKQPGTDLEPGRLRGHDADQFRRFRELPLWGFWCAPKGAITLWVKVPPGQWSVWPGSWQAAWVGNCPRRSPATNSALGGRAARRAVTCVKPEQAMRGKFRTPTRPNDGEGSTIRGSSRQMHLDRSAGVVGTARRDRGLRKRGRPVLDEGYGRNGAARRRSVRESDGA